MDGCGLKLLGLILLCFADFGKGEGFLSCGWCGMLKTLMSSLFFLSFSFLSFFLVLFWLTPYLPTLRFLAGKRVLWLSLRHPFSSRIRSPFSVAYVRITA